MTVEHKTTRPMLPNQCCKKCDHWKCDKLLLDPNDPDVGYGDCRKNPPRLIDGMVMAQIGAPRWGDDESIEASTLELLRATHFPVTVASDRCGDFMPRGGWPQI